MWKRIKHWWQAEGALVGLQGVSDRMLDDMGLTRETMRARVLAQQADRPTNRDVRPVGAVCPCTSA